MASLTQDTDTMATIALRPAREEDLGDILALVHRADRHDRAPHMMTSEDLRERLSRPYVDLADDVRLASRHGELAGWVRVVNPPSDLLEEDAFVIGHVDPDHRGSGVGRALLAWGVARAKGRLQSRTHALPRYIRVEAYDWMEANHRLYQRLGFVPVRWFEELRRPLDDLPTASVPGGVRIVPWPDDRDEEIRSAHNIAFADHWGMPPMEPHMWATLVRGQGARPDLSMIAVDAATDQIVAMCMNLAYPADEAVAGHREAWVGELGTLRQWRRLGLASAMIARSLAAFAADGFTHARIAVDADSPSGANRLYRSLGFALVTRAVASQIEVPASTSSA